MPSISLQGQQKTLSLSFGIFDFELRCATGLRAPGGLQSAEDSVENEALMDAVLGRHKVLGWLHIIRQRLGVEGSSFLEEQRPKL